MADKIPTYDTFVSRAALAQAAILSKSTTSTTSDFNAQITALNNSLEAKQDKLVSGTNISTINGQSLLEGGNISLTTSEGGSSVSVINSLENTSTTDALSAYMGKSLSDTITSHTSSTTIHITDGERTNWNDAFDKEHTHSNIAVLNSVTRDEVANWNVAATVSHAHSNSSALDAITTSKTTNWDLAYTNSHTHDNKDVLDTITTSNTTNWDEAYNNEHTHSNIAVLNSITRDDVANWNIASQGFHTHSNKSVLDEITENKISLWDANSAESVTVIIDETDCTENPEGIPVYKVPSNVSVVIWNGSADSYMIIKLPDGIKKYHVVTVVDYEGEGRVRVQSYGGTEYILNENGALLTVTVSDPAIVSFTNADTTIDNKSVKWICNT